MRRGLSLLWVVLTLVIAAVVGVLSYQAGVSTQLPAGAALPPYYYEPHFYGFGLFGLLFFVFIFFLLLRIFSFGRWAVRSAVCPSDATSTVKPPCSR